MPCRVCISRSSRGRTLSKTISSIHFVAHFVCTLCRIRQSLTILGQSGRQGFKWWFVGRALKTACLDAVPPSAPVKRFGTSTPGPPDDTLREQEMKNMIFHELAEAARRGESIALGIISGVKG